MFLVIQSSSYIVCFVMLLCSPFVVSTNIYSSLLCIELLLCVSCLLCFSFWPAVQTYLHYCYCFSTFDTVSPFVFFLCVCALLCIMEYSYYCYASCWTTRITIKHPLMCYFSVKFYINTCLILSDESDITLMWCWALFPLLSYFSTSSCLWSKVSADFELPTVSCSLWHVFFLKYQISDYFLLFFFICFVFASVSVFLYCSEQKLSFLL